MERHNGLEPDPEGAFVYHDDAQATIAALQTRVKELEQIAISHDQSMRYITGQAKRTHEKLTTVQATLTQRTAECDALKLVNDTHMKTVMKLSHIVEQQTAELEAANKRIHDLECQHQDLCLRNQILRDRPDLPVERASFHAEVVRMQAELERVRGEIVAMRQRKDGAYLERNRVVAALASCFPSGIARTAIEGWDEEWHGCVYIDLPTGQVSWHYHDSHAHLFAHLPPYTKPWDGHTTEEKYERVVLLKHRQGMEG